MAQLLPGWWGWIQTQVCLSIQEWSQWWGAPWWTFLVMHTLVFHIVAVIWSWGTHFHAGFFQSPRPPGKTANTPGLPGTLPREAPSLPVVLSEQADRVGTQATRVTSLEFTTVNRPCPLHLPAVTCPLKMVYFIICGCFTLHVCLCTVCE